ncbi:hypothetical protein [Treponema parvum]|uniref:hypothetical protein n=1 Tax=Treponema parvum TaxID=138851 RepID=UPI001AEC2EE4|nr:hypothetical protein [Treponema parvum]QTQ16226.1 hypothetical protein HXT04_05730 [Treponema parvum]
MNGFFYYLLISSAVLVYGIGFDRLLFINKRIKPLAYDFLKIFVSVELTTILSKIFTDTVIFRLSMCELFPFFTLLIYFIMLTGFNLLFYKKLYVSCKEFPLVFLFSLLSIYESSSVLGSAVIGAACVFSFSIIHLLIVSLKKRFSFFKPPVNIDTISLFYINMAIILIAVSAWNISWLNPEVFL